MHYPDEFSNLYLIFNMISDYHLIYYYLSLNHYVSEDNQDTQEYETEIQSSTREEYDVVDKLFQDSNNGVSAMPERPYYKEVTKFVHSNYQISKMLHLWALNKQVPVTFVKIYGLEEVEDDTER